MKLRDLTTKSMIAGVALTLSAQGFAAPNWANGVDKIEKCAGVALAGQNDCGANGHDCGGLATVDNDPNEWVYMPKGVCAKIGGKVIATKKRVISFKKVR